MPYINQESRVVYEWLDEVDLPYIGDPGEVNYVISRIIDYAISPEYGYTSINAAIGVLECLKLELYRRLAAPYETNKCEENGDVFMWTLNGDSVE